MNDDRPNATGIRVLIVDSDWRVRQSLSGLCALGDRIESVETAGDIERAIGIITERCPHVVLMDPRLPDIDAGLVLLARLRKCWPQLHVIAMSASHTLEDPALETGAVAFVPKGAHPAAFLDAIVAAVEPACGASRVPPTILDASAAAASPDGLCR